MYLTLCLRSRGHLTCGNCYGILNGVLFADGKCVAIIEDYKVSVTSGDEYSDPRYLL